MFLALKQTIKKWEHQVLNSTDEEPFDVVNWIKESAALMKSNKNDTQKKIEILTQMASFYNSMLDDDQRAMVMIYLFGRSIDRI